MTDSEDRIPDSYPPEELSSLAGEYPFLTIAGGLALGALVGALLPRSVGRRIGKGVVTAATAASDLGLSLGRQVAERADGATRESRERIGQGAAAARQRASGLTDMALTAGLAFARKALEKANRPRPDAENGG